MYFPFFFYTNLRHYYVTLVFLIYTVHYNDYINAAV
eukprot:COSAG06_NODE_26352_length_616_cov_2.986460_2_plen_35_part_01